MGASSRLCALIRDRRDVIEERFVARVCELGLPPRPMPRDILVDHLGELLDQLAEEPGPDERKHHTSHVHAEMRFAAGFDLGSLVCEYGLLWRVLVELAREEHVDLPLGETDALSKTLWDCAVAAVRTYERLRDAHEAAQTGAIELVRGELEGFTAAAPLGIALLDRDLRFKLVNPVLAKVNGVPAEEHIGKTPMEIVPDLSDPVLAVARRVLETGELVKDFPIEVATPATAGAKRHFLEQWFPIRVKDEIVGLGAIVEDVTERRRAESARDRIVAVVSHDLRNPLSAILMACSLLFARAPRPDIARLGARIQRSALRMQAIVGQLFDFARLDHDGHLPLDRARVDVGELLERVVEETELASPRRDLAVRIQREGNLDVVCDETRIAQVFSNLVGNALQHGQRSVVVRAIGHEHEVVVEVANGGKRIPPEVLARIFDPFESTASDATHLGLGLFITREIARAHGGRIEARSDDESTTFVLTLPRA